MKRITSHILSCCLSALAMFAASCVYDEGPFADDVAGDADAVFVSFRLTMHGVQSRADGPDTGSDIFWGDNYISADAIPFEERIDPDSFHAVLYSADGTCLGSLVNLICTGAAQSASGNVYDIMGTLSLRDPSLTIDALRAMDAVKMMVTANVDGVTAAMEDAGLSREDAGLGSLTFDRAGCADYDFKTIPMWGVCTHSLAGIKQGEVCDMGSVSMLRAMAKIEVGVSESDEALAGVAVNSVALNRMNTRGYVLPRSWNTAASTVGIKLEETMRIPAEPAAASARSFSRPSPYARAVTFYVPECANAAGADGIVLTVTYTVGSEVRTGELYLSRYDEQAGKPIGAAPWDIIRNYYYQYTIIGVGATSDDLRFKVTIADMEKGGEWTYEY